MCNSVMRRADLARARATTASGRDAGGRCKAQWPRREQKSFSLVPFCCAYTVSAAPASGSSVCTSPDASTWNIGTSPKSCVNVSVTL